MLSIILNINLAHDLIFGGFVKYIGSLRGDYIFVRDVLVKAMLYGE